MITCHRSAIIGIFLGAVLVLATPAVVDAACPSSPPQSGEECTIDASNCRYDDPYCGFDCLGGRWVEFCESGEAPPVIMPPIIEEPQLVIDTTSCPEEPPAMNTPCSVDTASAGSCQYGDDPSCGYDCMGGMWAMWCESEAPPPVFCTQDVHDCGDGVFVSRNATNDCEFDPCPEETVTIAPKPPQAAVVTKAENGRARACVCLTEARKRMEDTYCTCK